MRQPQRVRTFYLARQVHCEAPGAVETGGKNGRWSPRNGFEQQTFPVDRRERPGGAPGYRGDGRQWKTSRTPTTVIHILFRIRFKSVNRIRIEDETPAHPTNRSAQILGLPGTRMVRSKKVAVVSIHPTHILGA